MRPLPLPMLRLPHIAILSWVLAATLSVPFAPPALSQDVFTGRVVAVTDGDTVGVIRNGAEVRIRLHGVDAPETGQAFGSAAKQFTSKKVFGQTVSVRVVDTDRYGRLVGEITAPGGESLNLALVRNGYAWWYHQYGARERELALAEIEARAAKRGLWTDGNPQPPWAFRNVPRPAPAPAAGPAAVPLPPRTRAVTPVPLREPAAAAVFITRTGEKYHRAGCRYLRRSQIPIRLQDARLQGYTPCSVCSP